MRFKRRLQEMAIFALVMILSGVFAVSAEAKFLKDDEFDKGKYYDNPGYIDITVKAKNISESQDGRVFFEVERTFDEEYTGEDAYNNGKKRDYKFYIDEETDIYDHYFFSWEDFLAGTQPWVSFYITAEDYGKLKNGELKEVHTAAFYETAAAIEIYPSYNERVRNKRLKELGIMVGDADGKFHPYRILSRAELTKIAVMISNPDFAETVIDLPVEFTDLDKTDWAYPYIAYAVQSGIVSGYPDGSFKPDMGVTGAEAAKIFMGILGYVPSAEQSGGYPDGYMKEAALRGILDGLDIKAEAVITRSEAASMAFNALDIHLMKAARGDEQT